MSEAVQVAVRVRPFNQREKDLNAELCLRMSGSTTVIWDKEGKELVYAFDESLWSHDGFGTRENGYMYPLKNSDYADQAFVFERFGKAVLDNAWGGFHCCLFAYGQTGSGKSYSMVGYGANKGIVPLSCEEIFRRIEATPAGGPVYEVTVSMIEIYNETVQDLIVAPDDRPRKGLEIRENKMLGIYIDGVQRRAVDSYAAIEAYVDEATSNRTVGSTLMNATSSRAHTVMTIEFKQTSTGEDGKKKERISMINLVDLAGSEKAGQTGATGERLKEGCAINMSLSALGNVIEKLAQRSGLPPNKAKAVLIPYRDSKLTRLLQNALGGNSRTIMICALSPASSNHEETCSTLRYADRAKKIKNNVSSNEDPMEKLKRELMEENQKLKDMLEELQTGKGDDDKEGVERAIAEKAKDLADAQARLDEMQESFEDKLRAAEEARRRAHPNATRADKFRSNVICEHSERSAGFPRLVNLNRDPRLSGRTRHILFEGDVTYVTNPCSVPPPESLEDEDDSFSTDSDDSRESLPDDVPKMVIMMDGVFFDHARISNEWGRCGISTYGVAVRKTYINGRRYSDVLDERRGFLEQELRNYNIDLQAYGKGEAKTITEFAAEIVSGAARIAVRGTGEKLKLVRYVDIILIQVYSKERPNGKVLVETEEAHPDGTSARDLFRLPFARRQPFETIQRVAERILADSGLARLDIHLEYDGVRFIEEKMNSPQYPGILTIRSKQIVTGVVSTMDLDALALRGLPAGTSWSEVDERGVTRTYQWMSEEQAAESRVQLHSQGKEQETDTNSKGKEAEVQQAMQDALSIYNNRVVLEHGDRVGFGEKALYLFVDPVIEPAELIMSAGRASFEKAAEEIQKTLWSDTGVRLKKLGAKGLAALAVLADQDTDDELDMANGDANQNPHKLIAKLQQGRSFAAEVALAAKALDEVLLATKQERYELYRATSKFQATKTSSAELKTFRVAMEQMQRSVVATQRTLEAVNALDAACVALAKAEHGLLDGLDDGLEGFAQDDAKAQRRGGKGKGQGRGNTVEVKDPAKVEEARTIAVESAKARYLQAERTLIMSSVDEATAVQSAIRAEYLAIKTCDAERDDLPERLEVAQEEKQAATSLLPAARRRLEAVDARDKERRALAVVEADYKHKLKRVLDDTHFSVKHDKTSWQGDEENSPTKALEEANNMLMMARSRFHTAEANIPAELVKELETKLKLRKASAKLIKLQYGEESREMAAVQAVIEAVGKSIATAKHIVTIIKKRQQMTEAVHEKQHALKLASMDPVAEGDEANSTRSPVILEQQVDTASTELRRVRWREFLAPLGGNEEWQMEKKNNRKMILLQVIESGDPELAKQAVKTLGSMAASRDQRTAKAFTDLMRVALHGDRSAIVKAAGRVAARDSDPEFRDEAAELSRSCLSRIALERMQPVVCSACGEQLALKNHRMHSEEDEEAWLQNEINALSVEVKAQDEEIVRLQNLIDERTKLRASKAKQMHPRDLCKEVVQKFGQALEAVESAEAAAIWFSLSDRQNRREERLNKNCTKLAAIQTAKRLAHDKVEEHKACREFETAFGHCFMQAERARPG